ncbi:MAG: type 2 isopentenyl-diphosphate Delta-isomerase [Candidatus Micrarchaeia archaeon]
MAGRTPDRKGAHVRISLEERVESRSPAGFDDVRLLHNPLPELGLGDIELGVRFLGKRLAAPLVITAMTGGFKQAGKINKEIAAAAEAEGIAFGLGSQRAMIEQPSLAGTYYVRDAAPKTLVLGNIGAAQLKEFPLEKIEWAVAKSEVDALAIHLNPLQEAVQREGDKDFGGCLKVIERACEKLSIPVIAKETGAGIPAEAALRLQEAGVKAVDVSGLGGTSWALVEGYRSPHITGFDDWGIPTVVCIAEAARALVIPVIGSGGVRSGLDAAKCIALGAALAGASLPFLKAWNKGGAEGVRSLAGLWKRQLRTAMLLTGSRDLEGLRKTRVLVSGKSAELLRARGIEPREYGMR